MKLLKHQRNEYKMKVGVHQAAVICKNKREGKQRAAQSILQKMHAHLNSWGALLKLYGRGSCKTPKEKRVRWGGGEVFVNLNLNFYLSFCS